MIDDGLGSGPSSIEWSSDSLTWSTLREDGLILWVDWSNTELFVRVTDGANLQSVLSLEIAVPLMNQWMSIRQTTKILFPKGVA